MLNRTNPAVKILWSMFVLSFLLSGCNGGLGEKKGKSEEKKPEVSIEIFRRYDLPKIEVNDAPRSTELNEVIEKLNSKQLFKLSVVDRILTDDQTTYYNNDAQSRGLPLLGGQELRSFIDGLASGELKQEDQHQLKLNYEEKLLNLHKSDAKYFSEANTLGHIFKENLLQCYSATMLHELVRRKSLSYLKQNNVVIFESGHVLPGYMQMVDDKWHLVGIEGTVLTEAKVEYGEIDSWKDSVRIVDAELFAIMEILKNRTVNEAEISLAMLQQTAEKYGFVLPVTHGTGSGTGDGSATAGPNSSPFAFGVPASDLEVRDRERVSVLKPRGSSKVPSVATQQKSSTPVDVSRPEVSPAESKVEQVSVEEASIEADAVEAAAVGIEPEMQFSGQLTLVDGEWRASIVQQDSVILCGEVSHSGVKAELSCGSFVSEDRNVLSIFLQVEPANGGFPLEDRNDLEPKTEEEEELEIFGGSPGQYLVHKISLENSGLPVVAIFKVSSVDVSLENGVYKSKVEVNVLSAGLVNRNVLLIFEGDKLTSSEVLR